MAVTISGQTEFFRLLPTWRKLRPFFGASAIILVTMIIGKSFSFLWRLLLLRYNFTFLGEIELFSTTLGLATSFSTLALPASLIRFSLRQKTKAWNYLLHSFGRSFQALIVVSIGVWFISRFTPLFTTNTQLPFPLFIVIVLLVTSQKLSLSFLNSQKKFTLYGLGEYVLGPGLKFVLLVGILLGVFRNSFLFPHVIWSIVLTALVGVLFILWQRRPQTVGLSRTDKKTFLSYSLFLSSSFLSFMVYGALDVYILQYFFGLVTVSIYAGMLTLINLMDLIFLPFLHTFPAHLSERKTRVEKVGFTSQTVGVLVKLGGISGFILAGFGSIFFNFFSKNTLNIPFWTLIAFAVFKVLHYGVVHVYRHYLDFQGEQKYTARTMLLSLGTKFLLCIILVESWGLIGLATANIVTDLLHINWLTRRTYSRQ